MSKASKEDLWQRRVVREGRGQILAATYEPYIQVRRGDFSSRGVSHITPEEQGDHHSLSTVERTAREHFTHLGAARIYTQAPMFAGDEDVAYPGARGTLELAASLGLRHPRTAGRQPRVLTLDCLVEAESGARVAVYVRYEKDLPRPGTREHDLLRLANLYWNERNHPLRIYTEKDLPAAERALLVWAYDGRPDNVEDPAFVAFLRRHYKEGRPLIWHLDQWGRGRADAVRNFKMAVLKGTVKATPRIPVRSLLEVWPLQFPDMRLDRLEDFLNQLRRCDG